MADQNNAPERIWVRVTDKTVMYAKPSDADEFDVEYIRADRAAPEGQPVTLTYTNWRGETAERTITPKRIWFGSTDWHPEPQWLLTAFDAEKQADRDFALKDFGQAPPPAAPTDNTALVEAAYHAGIDAAANRYRVCASPDVWDYFYTAYNAMLDLKTFPMPAALASREAQQPAGEAMPVGCGQPCGYDCNGACFDPHACQQEAVTDANLAAARVALASQETPQTIEPIASRSRHGDWMQTASGIAFWPVDPRPEDVRIYDIAHSLSNMCRYGGHCTTFYSVAQHSVLVSRALPPELKMWGLLHDASEAYVVDVPRPLKPFLTGYREAEDSVMAAIADAFDLCPRTMPSEVKRIDNAILADEATQIMGPPPRAWTLPEPPLGIKITPVGPEEARQMFLAEYAALRAMKGKSDVD